MQERAIVATKEGAGSPVLDGRMLLPGSWALQSAWRLPLRGPLTPSLRWEPTSVLIVRWR